MATRIYPGQWQCGKSLSECLGFMLENEISWDVSFIVGEKKVEIRAHKTILISRSPVFKAMFNGSWQETTNIIIPDVEHDIFKQVLRYMYTDELQLTEHTVIPVLYAAKKYCLDVLSQHCVESFMTKENAFTLYEQSHLYDDQDLQDKCIEKIKRNSKKCLESPSFLELCHKCCEKIVSSDWLMVEEEIVYENVIKWSIAECTRQELEDSEFNQRNVLGSILYNIRFPLLNKDYFDLNLSNNDILSSDEKLSVVQHHSSVADNSTPLFSDKKRLYFNERIIRFMGVYILTWNYDRHLPDKIGFQVSKDAMLHGVILYGDDKNSEYSVDLLILDDLSIVLSSITTKYTADGSFMSDILLETPVHINAKKYYKVIAMIYGPGSKAGVRGLTTITANGITISFSGGAIDNGTNTHIGQIPGLLLSYRY